NDGTVSGLPANTTSGTIKIKDFQWPATIAAGVSFTPDEKWMVAADVKILQWSDTMKNFNMVFSAGGESADITFYQN
ncbi:MAG: aromatic hydrocarbon degradation protein, partial [Gammaproteobacteria bacterium]|nr:aromatic hydrocarbon degradation protein [Gammaproteobacteria bacterium]NIR92558.1 aromatic hydrocarbon degradation protein [Gammaproteobacteria bacterium]